MVKKSDLVSLHNTWQVGTCVLHHGTYLRHEFPCRLRPSSYMRHNKIRTHEWCVPNGLCVCCLDVQNAEYVSVKFLAGDVTLFLLLTKRCQGKHILLQ